MNNNEIQRYTSILLGKENVETLSDLQLLFNRYKRECTYSLGSFIWPHISLSLAWYNVTFDNL